MNNQQNTDLPFFTILTAALNSQSTIKQTLTSINKQTFQNFEHIVIDGASKDDTPNLLKTFKALYNLIWLSEPDKGIADALNKGLKLSNGRYILIIHADDQLLAPTTLEYVYRKIRNEKYDICSFPVLKDHKDQGVILYNPIKILWWHHFKTIVPHQGSFVHQRAYDTVGGYRNDFSIAMDYDFFYRALKNSCSVKFGNKPVAFMGGAGISSNDFQLLKRLREEVSVQKLNEKNSFWRLAQIYFWMLYFPYKMVFFTKLKKSFIKRKKSKDLITLE